ncbi:DUF5949 family protein [Streptacidiphilus cavernicola]|uniref:DUF5949 family protein n=1 Tax=Streptacidiphilus cavernicola TaxID=3342716 RepID=A0ABV6VXV5_9ACTN
MGRQKPGKPRREPSEYNPLTGLFGQLIMTGWIGEDPRDGTDIAFIYLGTPADGATGTPAAEAMAAAASALGLNPQPGSMTENPAASTHLTFTDDGWAQLSFPSGENVQHPGSLEWRTVAQHRGTAVLVLTYLPLLPGEDTTAHCDQALAAGQFTLGLIPVR